MIYVREYLAYTLKSFMVSYLIFKSLSHFEFIFMYDMRVCSYFIDLQVAVQLSQHHLLMRLSFLHCIFFPPLLKINHRCGFISGLSIPFFIFQSCQNYVFAFYFIKLCFYLYYFLFFFISFLFLFYFFIICFSLCSN